MNSLDVMQAESRTARLQTEVHSWRPMLANIRSQLGVNAPMLSRFHIRLVVLH
jgi:hypothetical protein